MEHVRLSRFLGWFSLGLGAIEAVAPRSMARTFGLFGKAWLVRAFGVREVAAGLVILAVPTQPLGPILRVAGDVLDAAVLAPALSPRNGRRDAALAAFAVVLGVTALDVYCASALARAKPRRAAASLHDRLLPPDLGRNTTRLRDLGRVGRALT